MNPLAQTLASFRRAPLAFVLAGPLLAGGLLFPAAPARAQAVPAPSLALEEKLLGELSPGSKLENAMSVEDHLAWVEKKGNKQTVKLDGQPVGGVYDDVGVLRFSRDRQHLAFTAKRDSKWVLVLDGKERTRPYGRLTAPALSPNAKSFTIGACDGKSCHLVADGEEVGPEFEDVSAPWVDADGEHVVYFGKRDKKWTMQLDGKPYGPPMDDYFTWRCTRKVDHVGVAALIDKHWTWVVDQKPGPGFDVVSNLAVTPDWQHHAYAGADSKTGAAKNKTSGALVEDGKITARYEGSGFGSGVLGTVLGSYSYMLSGVRSFAANFHGLSDPQYAPDGKLLYAARRAESDIVVITAGTPGPSFEDVVSPIVFSDDGKHVAYVASRGNAFVPVVDHKAGAEVAAKGRSGMSGLSRSARRETISPTRSYAGAASIGRPAPAGRRGTSSSMAARGASTTRSTRGISPLRGAARGTTIPSSARKAPGTEWYSTASTRGRSTRCSGEAWTRSTTRRSSSWRRTASGSSE